VKEEEKEVKCGVEGRKGKMEMRKSNKREGEGVKEEEKEVKYRVEGRKRKKMWRCGRVTREKMRE
jgi:hypothetical protein